jgi:hypothetical protein
LKWQRQCRGLDRGLTLEIGGEDVFEFMLPVGSTFSTLKITSACKQEFSVWHTLPPGYKYSYCGLDARPGRCHDIHVKATAAD